MEACNQDLKKRYQEGLKKVVASSQASTTEQFNPQSSHGTPVQSLQKAIQAKPVTEVVKREVFLLGGSIVGKPSRGHVTPVIKAQPVDIVQEPEATEPLGGACALPLVPIVGPPGDQTNILAPAPKEDTLDCLGYTIHEQAPGNVY